MSKINVQKIIGGWMVTDAKLQAKAQNSCHRIWNVVIDTEIIERVIVTIGKEFFQRHAHKLYEHILSNRSQWISNKAKVIQKGLFVMPFFANLCGCNLCIP